MKILFLQYSHPTLHSEAHKLGVCMAKSGHEIHWANLYHKRIATKKTLAEELDFSIHTLSNPYGNSSGALLFDTRSPLTKSLLATLKLKLPQFSNEAHTLIEEIQPDLIITEGIIALSVVAHLNVNLQLNKGIVPWIHYFDEDYKYGLHSNEQTKQYTFDVLRESIKQPDALWASSPAYAHRVFKDYNLAFKPEVITGKIVLPRQKTFEQSTHGTKIKILVDSLDQKQLNLLKTMMDSMNAATQKLCSIYDIRPQWPVNGQPLPVTQVVAEQSAKLQNRIKRRVKRDIKRALNRPISDGVETNLPEKKTAPEIAIIRHCQNLGAQYFGGIHYPSQYYFEGLSYKKIVIISLVGKKKFETAITNHISYGHKAHVLILNGDKENLDALADNGKSSITTDDIVNSEKLSSLLSHAYENLVPQKDEKRNIKNATNVIQQIEDELSLVMESCSPVDNNGPLKVWHGLTGCAGQPWIQSNAQIRAGIFSRSMIVGPNYLNYKVHKQFSAQDIASQARALVEISRNYNVAHFYFRSLFYQSKQLAMPSSLDMLALRAAGKTVIMNFRGSEVRLQNDFKAFNPYHYVDEAPPAVAKFPDEIQRRYLDFTRAVCSELVVIDPELGSFVPDAKVIPRSLNLDEWAYIGQKNKNRPVIVHAPTKADIKGTSHILGAIDTLEKEGLDFEFRLIQGLSNKEAREAYKEADILVDQLRIGWYGVLSVEAMALGKAVVCYIREDLLNNFPKKDRPFCIANPDTITDQLRTLILSPALRKGYADRGYEYCKKVHDSDKVAQQYIELYEETRKNPKPFDLTKAIELIEWQEQLISSETNDLIVKIRKKVAAKRP